MINPIRTVQFMEQNGLEHLVLTELQKKVCFSTTHTQPMQNVRPQINYFNRKRQLAFGRSDKSRSFFPEKFTTFPEILKESGYKTGKTGKGWAPEFTKGKKRDLIGKDYSKSKVVPPAKFISDNDYSGNFKIF